MFTGMSLAIFFGVAGAMFLFAMWITPSAKFLRAMERHDDSDPPDGRSHMTVLTDHKTGRQYLAVRTTLGITGITPRLDPLDPPSRDTADERVERVWRAALRVWKTQAEAEAFLTRAHPLLEGRSPVMVASSSGVGVLRVEEILGKLEYGTAV